jgi:hypothetical protein
MVSSRGAKPLPELNQLLFGNVSVFGLKAQSMLFALMFDDGEVNSTLRPIQTLADSEQGEMARPRPMFIDAGAGMLNGDHRMGGCRAGAKCSRTRRHCVEAAIDIGAL